MSWRRPLVVTTVIVLSTTAFFAPEARAQSRQGEIFNADLFNVGGVGVRDDDDLEATRGSIGCGGEWGDRLTTILNEALNENVAADTALLLGQRRDLWRFCDGMTNEGAGWDVNTVITPDEEHSQNAGYAPAEMFGQADVAQSIASGQVVAVANRVQQVRTAMRDRDVDPSYALTRTIGRTRAQRPTPTAFGSNLEPMNFKQREALRPVQSGSVIANALAQGMNSGDETFGIEGLGVFLSGRYIRVEADTTSRELGSNTDGGGFTLGTDYRIGSSFLVGAGFGYNHYSTDFSRDAGESDIDDFAGLLFGSAFIGENFYVDATIRGSHLKTDIKKRTPTLDGGPDFATQKSDPEGWTISSDLGAGAEMSLGPVLLNPYLRIGVYQTKIDGFTESGGDGSMSLVIESQKVTSLPMTLGASVVYYLSTPIGVVAPYLRAQYMHEFLDQADTVKGFLKIIPEAKFKLKPNSTDRNYGTIGTGASVSLARRWSGYLDYDALVGFSALESHTLTAGFRREL